MQYSELDKIGSSEIGGGSPLAVSAAKAVIDPGGAETPSSPLADEAGAVIDPGGAVAPAGPLGGEAGAVIDPGGA